MSLIETNDAMKLNWKSFVFFLKRNRDEIKQFIYSTIKSNWYGFLNFIWNYGIDCLDAGTRISKDIDEWKKKFKN